MKYITIDRITEIMNNFFAFISDPLHKKERQELNSFICDYFGEDFSLEIEEWKDNNFLFSQGMFDLSIIIAYTATYIPTSDNKIFKNEQHSHLIFYNAAYLWGYLSLFSKDFYELIFHFVKEINKISLSNLFEKDWDEDEEELSEAELYALLVDMRLTELSIIINNIHADKETKNIIKKAILDKDENTFIETLFRANTNANRIGEIVELFSLLKEMRLFLLNIPSFDELHFSMSAEKAIQMINDFINADKDYVLDDNELEIVESIYSFIHNNNLTNNKLIPDIDWSYLFLCHGKVLASILYYHQHLRTITKSIKDSIDTDQIINNWPYTKWLNEEIISGRIIPVEFDNLIEPLTDFHNKFCKKLELPDNINDKGKSKKSPEEYLDSNRTIDKKFCIEVYYALVDEHLLRLDNMTFYSFIYRMCFDYKGKDEPIQMEWLGRYSELATFIWWFCDGSVSCIWEKTKKFFILPGNKIFNTKGALNGTNSQSKKIKRVIEKFKKN